MQTKGLDMRKNGNVVLIAPREELAVKEKQQLESMQQINDLEPLQTEMFQLNYQKADAIKALISDKDGKFLSKRGTAVVDARTNILFVQDTGGTAGGSAPADPPDRRHRAAGRHRKPHRHRR